jgi:hypothetical protein
MRKASLRWWAVWVVLGSLISLVSAFPATVIIRDDLDGGVWWWEMKKEAGDPDKAPEGTILTITNSAGLPWSLTGGFTGQPTGWLFSGDMNTLEWTAQAGGGQYFLFYANPVGASNTTGSYSVDYPSDPDDSGSLLEVPVVPEASTACLLAVGLLAGTLLRLRRKREES